jgi:NADPH:quinone reductase-like Zn-dependent oxidoreductase
MNAVLLNKIGSEEGLDYQRDCVRPTPRSDDVLVKVCACGISDTDRLAIKGEFSSFVTVPSIIGYELSGVVEAVGDNVTEYNVGDAVVGLSPLDIGGGFAEYALIKKYNIIKKPSLLSHEKAASIVAAGVRAYTALHYQMHLSAGDSILICNGVSANGQIALQLADIWGAKIITTSNNVNDFNYLHDLNPNIIKVIDLSSENPYQVLMNETGGLGVDHIYEATASSACGFSKKDLIKCLSPNGHWVTSSYVQLDPPESRILTLKGCSLSFVFEHSWVLSNTQQGRFLHILQDLMEKAGNDSLKCPAVHSFPLEKVRLAVRTLEEGKFIGKIVLKP